jgi:hypothetical protein
MTLSKRATEFLNKSKRENSQLSESEIRQIFTDNRASIFEPLIEFQQKFGGYIFHAGLAPIKFGIIKGEGGYPKSSNTAIIEFEESELASHKYFFDCATTEYQMQFFLDEKGVYYEDYEAKASSFYKTVEHLALWYEMNYRNDFELLFRDHHFHDINLDKELKLNIIPEASDQYTLWFSNEEIYMQQCQGLSTIVISNSCLAKPKLLELAGIHR